jgi:hypothetical protein
MKNKPIRVDWDELEVAFTNHDEEIVYYLDLVTGHVVLDGEGEEPEFDDDDDFSPNHVIGAAPPKPAEGTRAYVTPMSTEMKLAWMERFLKDKENGLDAETQGQLQTAFDSEQPAEDLSKFLRAADEARDIWYLYRSDRLHEYIQEWLNEHHVTPIDPAPWAED